MQRLVFGALGCLAVAGCTPGPAPVKSLALVEGGITATAPAGYCVDPAASKPTDGFAVMAACASLGSDDKVPDVLGVATVQVGPSGSGTVTGSEDALLALLESDAGAMLLSAGGDQGQINVIGAETGENTVTVHFNDDGPPPIDGLQGEEWRAFTDIGGRLVTVAVRGLETTPLQDGTGNWLLGLVVNGLLATGNSDMDETSTL